MRGQPGEAFGSVNTDTCIAWIAEERLVNTDECILVSTTAKDSMDEKGQVYFDDNDAIPEVDRERYEKEIALLREVKMAAYDTKLREMQDAKGR